MLLQVHCDPHPGNVLVRRRPANPKKHQLVIIDHGLYISLADSFRQQYCELWRALLVMDTKTVENIARSWGFAAQTDLFASATLLQPFKMRKSSKDSTSGQTGGEDGPQPSQSTFEAQSAFKNRLKSFLENEQLVPRELIFLTRCMRMLQATNQILGSPVNRINLLAESAVSGLAIKTSRSHGSLWKRLAAVLQVVRFKLTLVGEWLALPPMKGCLWRTPIAHRPRVRQPLIWCTRLLSGTKSGSKEEMQGSKTCKQRHTLRPLGPGQDHLNLTLIAHLPVLLQARGPTEGDGTKRVWG